MVVMTRVEGGEEGGGRAQGTQVCRSAFSIISKLLSPQRARLWGLQGAEYHDFGRRRARNASQSKVMVIIRYPPTINEDLTGKEFVRWLAPILQEHNLWALGMLCEKRCQM